MNHLTELWRRLTYWIHRNRIQRELEEEMAAHREMMGVERARSFGSTLKLREESNEAWGFGWWDRLLQDLRYGLRMMRKAPGFSLTAVLVLALGIGVNITAFEFLNFFVLRPLPVKDPHTLVRITRKSAENTSTNVSYKEYEFIRDHNTVFSAVMGSIDDSLLLDSGEKLTAHFVTRNFLDELGMIPAYGQSLRRDALEPGAVVIGYQCFQNHFGGDSSWIGRTVELNHRKATIIGVAPAGFTGLATQHIDVWAAVEDHPLYFPGSDHLTSHASQPMHLKARLSPGVSIRTAEDALRPLLQQLYEAHPQDYWKGEWAAVQPGGTRERLEGNAIPAVAIASVLVLLVLFTACANLGNLLLARGVARERELSIRGSVGASRWRLVRQLLTESLMLALLGAAAGLGFAILTMRALLIAFPAPLAFDLTPDWRILAFAGGMALLATLLFGLAPALQTTRRTHAQATRLRTILLTTQVAASCALLIVSGLLVRGLHRGLSTDPGFDYEQSLTVDPNLYAVSRKGEAARAYLDQLQSRLRQVTGVESVTLATLSPFAGRMAVLMHDIGMISFNQVDGSYFETLRIPMLRGRTFQKGDTDVVILSERAAQRLWPNQDPIGKVFRTRNPRDQWTVIGVARNAPIVQFGNGDAMELYRPLERMQDALVIVRATRADAVLGAVQKVSNQIDSTVVPRVALVREQFELRLRERKLSAAAVSLLGTTAMLLAIVGLAGLISFTVTQRTREIGIRLALGASRAAAMRIGFERLLLPIGVGLAIGIGGATALGTALRSQLFGLSAVDPASYAMALLSFVLLGAASSLLPLRRAARVDPAVALRHE